MIVIPLIELSQVNKSFLHGVLLGDVEVSSAVVVVLARPDAGLAVCLSLLGCAPWRLHFTHSPPFKAFAFIFFPFILSLFPPSFFLSFPCSFPPHSFPPLPLSLFCNVDDCLSTDLETFAAWSFHSQKSGSCGSAEGLGGTTAVSLRCGIGWLAQCCRCGPGGTLGSGLEPFLRCSSLTSRVAVVLTQHRSWPFSEGLC